MPLIVFENPGETDSHWQSLTQDTLKESEAHMFKQSQAENAWESIQPRCIILFLFSSFQPCICEDRTGSWLGRESPPCGKT